MRIQSENTILNWYEAALSARERKIRGHFSTPPLLIEQILDACGYIPACDLSTIRVLDPACGSGNFLGAAVRRLAASTANHTSRRRSLVGLLERNIWGFDPDPISCFLSEMQIASIFAEEMQRAEAATPSKTLTKLPTLHLHQADALTLPWEQSVDLFLANPPYLAAKNTDLSGYRSARQRGQADSYLLFLNLALDVLRPGGWLALVLPDPVLARSNAVEERQRLLRETTVHHIWHLADVFHAYVGAVVIIAQKHPPPQTHTISWQRRQWRQDQASPVSLITRSGSTTQSLLLQQPRAEMRYLLSDARYTHITRLHQHFYTVHNHFCRTAIRTSDVEHTESSAPLLCLGDLVEIHRGEELRKDHAALNGSVHVDNDVSYPVLRGGVDVRPYATPISNSRISRPAVTKPLQRYLDPKLLVVKSTGRLQATLDLHGHVVLQTLYTLSPRVEPGLNVEEMLYFLLALLNSRLLQEYVFVLYTAYKWVQPQLEQSVLAHLPIPTVSPLARKHIAQRSRLLAEFCDTQPSSVELQNLDLYEELECAIRSLYEESLQAIPPPE